MKIKVMLMLSTCSISPSWAAQIAASASTPPTNNEAKRTTELVTSSAESPEVLEQSLITVTDDLPNIPAPLQAEAKRINAWSGSAVMSTADQWQSQRATNIKDVLDFIPGVFAQQRNGAESARISVRGSGLGRQFQGGGLLLLQDGVPLNTADGSFDFQAVDPWLIDYVTVYRGANGMAAGGSTLGGVINLGTTVPGQASTDPSQGNQLRLAAGSFSTRRAMLEYNPELTDSSQAVRLRASHFNQQGFRVQNLQNSNRFDLQYLNNQPSGLQHRLALFHLNTLAELPSSLSRALIAADPRQSRGFNINGNFNRDLTLTRLSYQLASAADSQQQWSSTVYLASKRLDNPVFTYINRDSDDAGMNFNWQRGAHSILFNTQWGQQDELRRENEGGSPGELRLTRQQTATTTTASYQYQQPLMGTDTSQPLTLVMGLQAIYAQRDIDEILPTALTSNRSYSQLNPRIGLLYEPQTNIQWFTNLSRSFEAPTFAELNNGNQPGINTPLKAQSADSFELGSRGFTARFSWDITAYYSQLDDEFIRFRFPNGETRTTNANQSTHWGLEAGLDWTIHTSWLSPDDQLNLKSSYQYNQFQLDNDPTFGNNSIPGIPEHYLQSQLQYSHPSGWSISPSIEWVPSAYYIDLANSYRSENYLLTGLSLTYNSPSGFEVFIDAKNLNDQNYISTTLPIPDAADTDGNYFYSGEGRAFYAGVSFQF